MCKSDIVDCLKLTIYIVYGIFIKKKGVIDMRVAGYICDNCQDSCDFSEDDVRDVYLCPKCNKPMWYFSSYEVDEITDKTIGDAWYDASREIKSPAPFSVKQKNPTITCPYCKSTNTKPISGTERAVSILGLGIFSKKINKSCKCLDCKCTW